jgi:molybdopterin-biosynthesis enzyme MoeA-like protein
MGISEHGYISHLTKHLPQPLNTMTSSTLPTILVARFLRSNNYSQTLDAFIREAGLPADVGQTDDKGPNWTIEGVLQEKKTFDQSVNFERYADDDKKKDAWSQPGEFI